MTKELLVSCQRAGTRLLSKTGSNGRSVRKQLCHAAARVDAHTTWRLRCASRGRHGPAAGIRPGARATVCLVVGWARRRQDTRDRHRAHSVQRMPSVHDVFTQQRPPLQHGMALFRPRGVLKFLPANSSSRWRSPCHGDSAFIEHNPTDGCSPRWPSITELNLAPQRRLSECSSLCSKQWSKTRTDPVLHEGIVPGRCTRSVSSCQGANGCRRRGGRASYRWPGSGGIRRHGTRPRGCGGRQRAQCVSDAPPHTSAAHPRRGHPILTKSYLTAVRM